MAARRWTAEQRAQQAAKIHQWQPWTRSTGARTPEGKAICSKNVNIGQAKKKKALELAKQELDQVLAKIRQLTSRRPIRHL